MRCRAPGRDRPGVRVPGSRRAGAADAGRSRRPAATPLVVPGPARKSDADQSSLGGAGGTTDRGHGRNGRRRPCERRTAAGSILVIDEGSSRSDDVPHTAAELAQVNLGDLVVLSPAAENGAGASRRRQIDQCLDGCHVGYTVQPLPTLDARTIVRLAEGLRKRLLLVLHSELLDEADLEILVKQLECPLALVP